MAKCIERAESHCQSYPRCYGCGAYREPTNADRIRSMSDEELAERMVGDVWDCCCCSEYDRIGGHPLGSDERCDEKCKEHCLDWLKQPVKDGEDDGNKF